MKSILTLMMRLIFACTSTAFASGGNVSDRLNRSELKLQRDIVKDDLHRLGIQLDAVEDVASESLLIEFRSQRDDFWKYVTVASALISVKAFFSYGSEFMSPGFSMGTFISAFIFTFYAGYKTGAVKDDVKLYRDTIERVKSMKAEQAVAFSKSLFEQTAQDLKTLEAIEQALNN